MANRYGWIPDVPDFRDYKLAIPHAAGPLPPSVDLRAGMPVVWDQGNLGSCTAHAIGAAVEFMQKKQKPAWDFMPSRLFVYYNERAAEGTIKEDAGAMIRTGIKVVGRQGVCKESLWKYDIAKFARKPSATAYKNATVHQALTYQRVPQTETGLKQCLAAGYPVVFGFSVYDSFESNEVANTGIVPLPQPSEKLLGGHAVCAAGYDDAKQMLLVRNSWGTGWGEAGYFWMPYAFVLNANLADDFWAITRVE